MVRLIKLIEQGLKRSESIAKSKQGVSPHKEEKNIANINFEIEDGYQYGLSTEKDRDKIEFQRALYGRLISLSSDTLEKTKNRERLNGDEINDLLTVLVDQFLEDPYNALLLYYFAVTEDNYLISHITNVTILSVGFARQLGFSKDEMVELGLCAFLHDLGMVHFLDIIEIKDNFDDIEYELIKTHPFESLEVSDHFLSEKLCNVILDVHEREKGQGYPNGKRGHEISEWAKIIAICDVYEALTHMRSFRKDYHPFEAIKMLIRMKDDLLEEDSIKSFINFISVHPVGSIGYLSTGEVAIVIKSNQRTPTTPVVRVLLTPENQLERKFRVVNLHNNKLLYIKGPVEREKERQLIRLLKPRGETNAWDFIDEV